MRLVPKSVALFVALLLANAVMGALSGVFALRSPGYKPLSTSARDQLATGMTLLPAVPASLVIVQAVGLRVRRPLVLFPLLGVVSCLTYFVALEVSLWQTTGAWTWDRNHLCMCLAIGIVAGYVGACLATWRKLCARDVRRGFPVVPVGDAADGGKPAHSDETMEKGFFRRIRGLILVEPAPQVPPGPFLGLLSPPR